MKKNFIKITAILLFLIGMATDPVSKSYFLEKNTENIGTNQIIKADNINNVQLTTDLPYH